MEDNKSEKILSKEYVIEQGINFDKHLAYGGNHDLEIVEFDREDNEKQFTGLVYDLFENGNLDSYMFVKEGIKQGEFVEFYPNGTIKRINNMVDNVSERKQVEYYENGSIMLLEERSGGFLLTFIKYDEQGNIIEEKKEPTEFDKMMVRKFG
ncbi:MAG: hypothetical protein RR531_12960 [Longicatena sp.]